MKISSFCVKFYFFKSILRKSLFDLGAVKIVFLIVVEAFCTDVGTNANLDSGAVRIAILWTGLLVCVGWNRSFFSSGGGDEIAIEMVRPINSVSLNFKTACDADFSFSNSTYAIPFDWPFLII